MTPLRAELEGAPRAELIRRARRAGVQRPDVMTRMELVDEILRLSTRDPTERKRVRGLLGVARDLIASVVEQGLNLPDAAALIRGDVNFEPRRPPQGPVATVTLAEIYAAQGHLDRAMTIIDEVLAKEPDHEVALALRERFKANAARKGRVEAQSREPEPEREPEIELELAARPAPELEDRELLEPSQAMASDLLEASSQPEPLPAEPARGPAAGPPLAVAFRSAPGQWTIAWELGHRTGGRLHVRAIEVIPSEEGAPVRREYALDVDGRAGSVVLNDIDESAILRAAVGYLHDEGFRAAAVATEIAWDAGSPVIRWAPRRVVPPSEALGRLAVQHS